jgi:hypothetical protein
MCNTLRRLVCAAWIAVAACSDGSDLSVVENPNAAREPPAPGATLPGGSPGAEAAGGVTPSDGSPSGAPQESAGPGAQSGGPPQPPTGGEAPAPASGEEPQPNATETNFFGAGCRKDADCGDTRRCELPADAGSLPLAPPEADAGPDAAPPELLVPIGHCVAL